MITQRQLRYILFDVDNTLYKSETGLLQQMDRRIEEYLQSRFRLAGPEIRAMRTDYWQRYGTTLGGLLAEHSADVEEYLRFIHDIPVESLLQRDPALNRLLSSITAEKAIFTNASQEHARRVLRALGIEEKLFRCIFDIQAMNYLGKPNRQAYHRLLTCLKAEAEECMLVDDSPANLRTAQELGMSTIQVGSGDNIGADYMIAEIGELADIMAILGLANS